jgi:hypothetical protein
MSKKQIEEYLNRIPNNVVRSCEVESLEESKIPQVLHISTNTNLKEMTPRICSRQVEGEDRTTPRIVGAPTIYGCILGYAIMLEDYTSKASRTSENKVDWKNGYKIYSIPYKFCLKPDKTLVPSAKQSDETWLVNYSEDTRTYEPIPVGRFFCTKFSFVPRIGELPQHEATIYVEVTTDEGLWFSKNNKLDKGYWKIEAPVCDSDNFKNLSWDDDEPFMIDEIKASDFFSAKRSVADLLSIADKVPAYLNW